jgi:predicted transcriptional regulator
MWKNGSCTVRDVNKIMNRNENTGYTTTLKQMQLMFEKGLLKRDENSKSHIYTPIQSESFIQEEVIGNILDKIFSGSVGKLVLHALSTKKISQQELASIKRVITQKEKEL